MAKLMKSNSISTVTIAIVYVLALQGFNCSFHCDNRDFGYFGRATGGFSKFVCWYDQILSPNVSVEWRQSGRVIGKCESAGCAEYICCWNCSASGFLGKYFIFPSTCSGTFTLIITQLSNSSIVTLDGKYYIRLSNSTERFLVFDNTVKGTDGYSDFTDRESTESHAVEFSSTETNSLSGTHQKFLHTLYPHNDDAPSMTVKMTEPIYHTTTYSLRLNINTHVNENILFFIIVAFAFLCTISLCIYIIGRKIYRCQSKKVHVHDDIIPGDSVYEVITNTCK